VDYGTTTAYGSAATSSVLTTSHSVALSGLTPGALYDFQVKSVDAQSEVALSANQTFNAVTDGTPPTVSFATPISGTSLTGTVTVSANAADNVAVASVQFMLDGANFGSAVTTPPYQTSWDTTATTNGSHTLTAIALDTSGNTASSTIIVTVENASPASTPSVSSGGGGSSYSLSIDNGAGTTATSSVTLSLYGTAAYTMEISNTPTFAGATWLPYVATMPWTIAPYPGPETVYAQFKAISGTIVGSTEASIDLISTGLSSSTSLSSQPSSPLSLFDQLKVLQSELAVLLAEANITITPSTTSFVFTHSLSFGMTSSDARRLQTFLAQDLALYLEGKVTGYFGALTLKAVERFQKKYGIANPGNLGYGTVGPLTRTKLNALIKQDLGP
jgi:hypothetical protein